MQRGPAHFIGALSEPQMQRLSTLMWQSLDLGRLGAVFRRRSLYEPIGYRSGRVFAEELSRFLNISGAWSANYRPSLGIYR